MTAPTSLIEALSQIGTQAKRCRVGVALDSRSDAERDAFEQALADKVAAGRSSRTLYPDLATALNTVTDGQFNGDDVRRHAKRECSCGR